MKSFYFLIISLLFIVLLSCNKSDTLPKQPDDPREQFLGTWKATDSFTESNGTIVTQTFTFKVDPDTNSDDFIVLERFANLSLNDLSAKVSLNSLIVSNTAVTVNNVQVNFEASGNINNQKLTYRYSMNGSGINREYTGTAVR